MNPAALRLLLPFLPLLLPLAALPALAQPGASWTETGDVSIRVFAVDAGGAVSGRDAANVLESDVIDEITVGEGGLLADQDSGTLAIAGIGTATVPRDLGDVFVLVGDLDLNDVFVDGNFIRIGSSNQTQFTDPSVGTMSVMLSEVASTVTVRNGSLGCQASSMDEVSILDLGRATFSDCLIRGLSGTPFSETSVVDSVIERNPRLRGTVGISRTTIDSTIPSVSDGEITLGLSGPVVWHNAGQFSVGGGVRTLLLASNSLIETQTTFFSGSTSGNQTTVTLQGATTWRSLGLFRTGGSAVEVNVNSGSRIDARDDLYISGGNDDRDGAE